MGVRLQTTIRRLGPGDEDVVRALAEPPREPQFDLLRDERTIYLVAFHDGEPIGFVLAYELQRRRGDPSLLFVYEVDVGASYRRRGLAAALLRELERFARDRGIREGFVLTDADNEGANALYASRGGVPVETVMWDFAYAAG